MSNRQETPIGFLLSRAHRRKGLLYRALLTPSKLTPRKFGILSRLIEDGSLSLSDLANKLFVDQTALSRTLRAMERDGLLQRVRDLRDRRVCQFSPTDKGAELHRRLYAAVRHFNDSILADFTPEEVESLRHLLDKMIINLSAMAENRADRHSSKDHP